MRLTDYHGYFYLTVFFTGIVVCEEEYCDAMDVRCNPDQIQDKLRTKLVVAAIDFGTTYSGWAYQKKADYFRDKLANIQTSKWFHNDILSKKTPTTVLIQPNGDTLEAFGYEAETRYLELASEEEHHQYYYFKRFKMMLYDIKDLDKKTKLVDDKGLELPALTVFSLAIRFLKENLMTNLKINDAGFKVDDVFWVLTVPAIWNDMAKTFMRAAAVVAGIETEDLEIALEPEAASLYCRLDQRQRQEDSEGNAFLESFQPGRRYALLDAGGGTIDTTVHEVVSERHLRELYKASGGPWGGAKVDLAFERMLSTLVGDRVFEEFKRKCAYDYLDIFRSFENIKRSITPDSCKTVGFRYPMCLDIILREVADTDIEQRIASTFKTGVGKKLDRLKLSAEIGRSFFKDVIDKIVENVKNLLEVPATRGVDTLLMVGGFSDSSLLQHAIRSNFEHNVKVIKPNDAELAIVKGAVLFGYNPSFFQERIARFTYGVRMLEDFREGVHDPTEKIEIDGVFKCKNLFNRFVKVGDVIRLNEVQGERVYHPASVQSHEIRLSIYACTSENPMYVKDDTCREIGSTTMDILERSVPLKERTFRVRFIFSHTEIKVSATELRTGNTKELYLNLKESQ